MQRLWQCGCIEENYFHGGILKKVADLDSELLCLREGFRPVSGSMSAQGMNACRTVKKRQRSMIQAESIL
jgi:hypothetical protein